jgi:type VI secretion system protein ImpH
MGAGGRRTTNSLERQLFEDGHEFDFFQAVRLLLRLFPEQQRVGNDAKPSEEVVRFGSRVSLEFPASAIHQIAKPKQPETPAHMTVTFFGLMGTQGVLPFHYTEWMLAREAAKDTAMAEFFDLFNHANFGQPGNVVGSAAFGRITNTRFPTGESGSSRQIQFALKLII